MDYADMIDADYKLIRGKPFRQNLTNACQKVHMIDEEFDEWDNVLMLDIDMFRPRNMSANVFEEKGPYDPLFRNENNSLDFGSPLIKFEYYW